jgi:outer membrane protein OmpA-like peptidoglycan-associated protein
VSIGLWLLLTLVIPSSAETPATAASMEAEINKTGSALVYGIDFQGGTATLSPGSERVLQEIIVLMKSHTDWRFEVQGHTTTAGDSASTLALSEQRARIVTAWLVERGVEPARLQAKGYGDTRPVLAGASREARALNVRIQLRKLNEEH